MKKLSNLPRQHHYGLRWQDYDPRDCKFSHTHLKAADLPSSIDLSKSKGYPSAYDQGQLGSCVSNGTAFAVEFDQIKQGKAPFMPSRLFIYYNGRVIEGTVKQDSGLQVRDGIKAVAKLGVCPESELPYNIARFKQKPSTHCYSDAVKELALQYEAVDNSNAVPIKSALASGLPVVFGITLYTSFESDTVAKTGIVQLPGAHEEVLGGHCMVIVGYDDKRQAFLVRNSWGSWGLNGHCWIPYSYICNTNTTGDCWVIKSVS
jgi:C1A family cysteine protease